MKIFLWGLSFLLLASCSSAPKSKELLHTDEPAPQVTNLPLNSYSKEELVRIELLEKYRQMRLKKIVSKKSKSKKKMIKDISVEPAPLSIQIEQTLTFFCIKNEERFSRPEDCKAHAENVLKKCEGESKNVIQCLKHSL